MSKTLDSKKNIESFIYATDLNIYDDLVAQGRVSYDVHYKSALLNAVALNSEDKCLNTLSYLLTNPCVESGFLYDLNYTHSPLHKAIKCNNRTAVKLLIDFRYEINDTIMSLCDSKTQSNSKKVFELIENYKPSYIDSLTSQLECKNRVDSRMSTSRQRPRYKQAEIDLKYKCISAVLTGDIGLLQDSIHGSDVVTTISLLLAAFEKGSIDLLGVLIKRLFNSSATIPVHYEYQKPYFVLELIGPLLYVGVEADAIINFLSALRMESGRYYLKPPIIRLRDDDIKHITYMAKVLSLFKLLYHKYIYLGVETAHQLASTLLLEGVYGHRSDLIDSESIYFI